MAFIVHRLALVAMTLVLLPAVRLHAADASLDFGAAAAPEEMPDGGAAFASDQGPYAAPGEFALAVTVPNLAQAIQFHAGLLYLRPSADNLGWAVLTTEKNFTSPVPIATPFWTIEALNPDYQPGLEIGAGYALGNSGKDVQVEWQHLRTSTSESAGITQSDGQWISPFCQTGPPTADSYDQIYEHAGVNNLLTAEAQVKFAYDSVNFDFGQYVNVGSLTMRMFAGVSYANLKEQLLSAFFGEPPAPGTPFPDDVRIRIGLNNTSKFIGVGPRLGIDSSLITRHGFTFTGQLAGALLIGRTQPAEYMFSGTSPELAEFGIAVNREIINSDTFTHVVYAANARLGGGYTRQLRSGAQLTVEGGYLAALYVNPFSGYETNHNILALQIGSLSTGSMRHTLSNFSLDGMYLNVALNW